MELSADLRTELLGLFEEILCADEHTVELPQATRVVGGCARLQSVLAAREATFAPIMRRLEIRAAQMRPGTTAGTDASDQGGGGSGVPGSEPGLGGGGGPASAPPPPEPLPDPVVPRVSAREQRRRDLRSRWLSSFERFAAAFNAGRVSPEHADALAAACERVDEWIITELRANEVRLVAQAETLGPEGFASTITDLVETIRADRGQTLYQRQLAEARAWLRFDRASGLYHLHGILDPQRGELLQSALDQRIAELQSDSANSGLPHGQLMLRALVELVMGEAIVTPRAIVVVDERTARSGMQHADTVCENVDGARLPIDVALAACASGNVTAAIIDRAGKPADLSSAQPLANAGQRAELRGMYRECVHPDCATPFSRCHQHHVTFREHRGRTTVSNMVPVCVAHHHDIHDRGWRLTIDAERTLRWYRPDGTLYAEVPQTRLDRRPTSGRRHAEPVAADGIADRQSGAPPPGSGEPFEAGPRGRERAAHPPGGRLGADEPQSGHTAPAAPATDPPATGPPTPGSPGNDPVGNDRPAPHATRSDTSGTAPLGRAAPDQSRPGAIPSGAARLGDDGRHEAPSAGRRDDAPLEQTAPGDGSADSGSAHNATPDELNARQRRPGAHQATAAAAAAATDQPPDSQHPPRSHHTTATAAAAARPPDSQHPPRSHHTTATAAAAARPPDPQHPPGSHHTTAAAAAADQPPDSQHPPGRAAPGAATTPPDQPMTTTAASDPRRRHAA